MPTYMNKFYVHFITYNIIISIYPIFVNKLPRKNLGSFGAKEPIHKYKPAKYNGTCVTFSCWDEAVMHNLREAKKECANDFYCAVGTD